MPTLTILSGFLLAPLIGGLFASVLCSLHILRDKRPPWYHALLSVALGILGALLVMFRGEVFHPERWPDRFPGQWSWLSTALAGSLPLTTVVVVIAVTLFRERFKKHLSMRERRARWRLRRQRSWRRARWFHLLGSTTLIIGSTGCLLCLYAARVPSADSAVADPATPYRWDPHNPTAVPPPSRPASPRPLFEITTAAVFLSPVCLLSLVAAGGWLAFTVSRWRGYIRVRPRHRRDLLGRHLS